MKQKKSWAVKILIGILALLMIATAGVSPSSALHMRLTPLH